MSSSSSASFSSKKHEDLSSAVQSQLQKSLEIQQKFKEISVQLEATSKKANQFEHLYEEATQQIKSLEISQHQQHSQNSQILQNVNKNNSLEIELDLLKTNFNEIKLERDSLKNQLNLVNLAQEEDEAFL